MGNDKWVMEDWMREALETIRPRVAKHTIKAYTEAMNKPEQAMAVSDWMIVGAIHKLNDLHSAGLLITPGERDNPLCDEIDRLRAENESWRTLLWLNHGCYGIPYGDDGEMQCGVCGVDFKRMKPAEIKKKWRLNAERYGHDPDAALGADDGK